MNNLTSLSSPSSAASGLLAAGGAPRSTRPRRKIESGSLADSSFKDVGPLLKNSAHVPTAPRKKSSTQGLVGKAHLNHRGFGFVTSADGVAYFMRANLVRFLLSGDEVSFLPLDEAGDGSSLEVRALTSIRRPSSLLMCEVHQVADLQTLVPDEPCFFSLQLEGAPAGAYVPGDVIAVRVPAFEGAPVARPLQVTFERNLGRRDRKDFDLDYAVLRYGFEASMPAELAKNAGSTNVVPRDLPVSDTPFVTIDGESTRDFDDAVYARALPSGGFEVCVAVSDVSWFIQSGSEIDAWAAKRCTSIYLPGRTLPMLPEELSTNQCSLLPGEVRRAVVMSLRLTADGEVVSSSISQQRIKSAGRLTYTQTAKFLAGAADVRFEGAVEANLQVLASVYAVLAARRASKGKLDFDEPEPTMVATPDGGWELKWELRNDAHKLVEEMMLLANREAAAMLVKRYGAGLFRHQPPPDAEAWAELSAWALAKSHEMPAEPSLRSMAALVAAQPTLEEQAAAVMKVRSAMRPARYVVQDEKTGGGHFSLSVDWYTHFTSPIRRYADLLVHRLLLAPEGFEMTPAAWEELTNQVAWCSDRAQASRMAERLVWDRLKLKGFTTETAMTDVVQARVMRITPRGLRVVIVGWQVGAWLPGSELRKQGYQLVDNTWGRPSSLGCGGVLQEGVLLPVHWMHVSLERPAYPELQMGLTAV